MTLRKLIIARIMLGGLLSAAPVFAQQFVEVPLAEGDRPGVSSLIIEYTLDTTYRYEYNSIHGSGGDGTSYETSISDGTTHHSQNIGALNSNGSLADYSFSADQESSSSVSRRSKGTVYPPYDASCKSKDTVRPVVTMTGGTVTALAQDNTHFSECIPNAPLRPTVENTSRRVAPAESRFLPSSMRPIVCSRKQSTVNSYSEGSYTATSSIDTTHEERGQLAIYVGGDPTLYYYISFEVVAEDLDNVTNQPQPLNIQSVDVGGSATQTTSVAGWMPGNNIYPISVTVASKCYGYGIGRIRIGAVARRAK